MSMTRGPQRNVVTRPKRRSVAWVTHEQRWRAQRRVQACHRIQEPVLRCHTHWRRVVEGRDRLHGDSRMPVQRRTGIHQMLRPVTDVRT